MVTLVQFSMGVLHLTNPLFSLLIWGTDLHCDFRLCLMTPVMGTKARNEFTELPEPTVIGTKL